MSTNVHVSQRLRKVILVGTLLSVAVLSALYPSASSEAHAAVVRHPANAMPGSKVYTIANCVQPPSNIDHATFTDAQLIKYGMPARSSFHTNDDFAKAVRAMKHRDCQYTVGTSAERFGENHGTSGDWAGYYQYGGNWSEEITEWYMGGVALCNSSFIGRAANWGGIGGVDNNYLVQSGSVAWCDDPISGNPNAVWYQMWYENLGDASRPDPEFDNNYQPNPGDLMESIVGGGYGCNYMAVTDVTTGPYFSNQYGPCGEVQYFDGIEENDVYGLAVNGDVHYTYCEGYDVPQHKWLVMGNNGSNYWDVTMVNQSTDAIPSSPPNQNGTGDFWMSWNGYNIPHGSVGG